jgi:hypothetical protein
LSPVTRHPSQFVARGNALLIVLWLIGLLFVFVLAATLLMRPAGAALDLHHDFARAHCAADSALQKALANLNAGRLEGQAGFADGNGELRESAVVRPPAGPDTKALEVTATGKARSRTPLESALPGQAWANVCLRAVVKQDGAGVWRVAAYKVAESSREVGR